MQPYPKNSTKENVPNNVDIIARLRDQDIIDRNNFPAIFLSGRSVTKIPASHSDVVASDRLGDLNITKTYAYCLVLDGITPKWGRWAVDVGW